MSTPIHAGAATIPLREAPGLRGHLFLGSVRDFQRAP